MTFGEINQNLALSGMKKRTKTPKVSALLKRIEALESEIETLKDHVCVLKGSFRTFTPAVYQASGSSRPCHVCGRYYCREIHVTFNNPTF